MFLAGKSESFITSTISSFKSIIMKTLLVIITTCLSSVVVAQKNNSFYQRINDDGKKLSIKINGTADGKKVDYNRTFDVSGMSKEERNALKERVYDSLGLSSPVEPVAPLPPAPPEPPQPVVELVAPVEVNSATVVTSKTQYTESYIVGGDHPYTKEIKYNPKSGVLFMKYRFVKKGEEVSFQKAAEAKNKSKEDRDEIIKKYEKEIGLIDN